MKFLKSTFLPTILTSTALAFPHKPSTLSSRDSLAFTMSTLTINFFTDPYCFSDEYDYGNITYGHDISPMYISDYQSITQGGNGSIGSYRLNRAPTSSEQLDFSMPNPSGAMKGPDGKPINDQCGLFLFAVGGNTTAQTVVPNQCYEASTSNPFCFRLWHA